MRVIVRALVKFLVIDCGAYQPGQRIIYKVLGFASGNAQGIGFP